MERMMRKKKETIRRRKMEKNKDVEKFREGKNKIQSTAARSKMKVKRCEFGRTKKEGWKRAKMRFGNVSCQFEDPASKKGRCSNDVKKKRALGDKKKTNGEMVKQNGIIGENTKVSVEEKVEKMTNLGKDYIVDKKDRRGEKKQESSISQTAKD